MADAVHKADAAFCVKHWSAVNVWRWDVVGNDTCAICRSSLTDACIDCQAHGAHNETSECTAAWGMCNHAFHFHCITRWTKTRQVCPLCNHDWDYASVRSIKDTPSA